MEGVEDGEKFEHCASCGDCDDGEGGKGEGGGKGKGESKREDQLGHPKPGEGDVVGHVRVSLNLIHLISIYRPSVSTGYPKDR